MPNKYDKIKLPRDKDRRRKLTDNDKLEIIEEHRHKTPLREIARIYQCSPRLVHFVVFPERLKRQQMLFKERRKDGHYYDKKKHTLAIKSLRAYKKRLAIAGLIKLK